ncbi:class I SAM-dependent methyltransferase [Luteimonas gilva]|uniref:Class I SAM-dependent methyltransferase n=1 Tax=Luteimonas gilva TaxID=2572684 RepID=A0A4U5JIY6_9GAMM|nr:class I SAM-dependent methyltransferase [Luteimonas gilva]TKR29502.1 class I SAM-dependent methyltransferase [Luteimonas gilva]
MKSSETASPHERPKTGAVDYDSELQLHDKAFRRACGVHARERVLDIGCGSGQTTRDAARAASAGSAVGIDISAPAIARARELAAAQDVRNVRFEQGDAQAHPLPRQGFDVAISRFGTMFFADLLAAFRNIRGALADNGRLVMMVWQAREANEWSTAIHGHCAQSSAAFSLADPSTVERILDAAGFADATFQDVREPVYYGDSVEAALDWIGQFQATREALRSLDAASAERERARIREIVERHRRDGGVWFDSRAWIVRAHCRRTP